MNISSYLACCYFKQTNRRNQVDHQFLLCFGKGKKFESTSKELLKSCGLVLPPRDRCWQLSWSKTCLSTACLVAWSSHPALCSQKKGFFLFVFFLLLFFVLFVCFYLKENIIWQITTSGVVRKRLIKLVFQAKKKKQTKKPDVCDLFCTFYMVIHLAAQQPFPGIPWYHEGINKCGWEEVNGVNSMVPFY